MEKNGSKNALFFNISSTRYQQENNKFKTPKSIMPQAFSRF